MRPNAKTTVTAKTKVKAKQAESPFGMENRLAFLSSASGGSQNAGRR
jgi:hypothetical protein